MGKLYHFNRQKAQWITVSVYKTSSLYKKSSTFSSRLWRTHEIIYKSNSNRIIRIRNTRRSNSSKTRWENVRINSKNCKIEIWSFIYWGYERWSFQDRQQETRNIVLQLFNEYSIGNKSFNWFESIIIDSN